MKRFQLYLSSTFEDLQEYRTAVFAALERAGLDVVRMEAYTAADERPLKRCLADVARCDIFVGLYAWRYGYEPPDSHGNPDGKSITELEYREAQRRKRPSLLFFAAPGTKPAWPARFNDEVSGEGDTGAKLDALRKELCTEKLASFFHTPDELAALVLAAVMYSGLSGRRHAIPPQPQGLVRRPELTNALVRSLVSSLGTSLVSSAGGMPAVYTVVRGAGGTGKTSLAIDACNTPEIIDIFPDGIFWITLGERPAFATILGDLHQAVTGNRVEVAGVEAIAQALVSVLEGHRCLLVIDDVWHAEDLECLLQFNGPRLLVTTRISTLVDQIGGIEWREIIVDQMDPDEGATLLGRGLPTDEATRQILRGLSEQLGCWPLLLDLASARLREEHRRGGSDLAACIGRVRVLLERRGVLGFDRRDSQARHTAVEKSVDAGLDFAEEGFPGIRQKAAELSLFPEDVPVPARVLADLWRMKDIDVEEDVIRPLDMISVLSWDRQTGEVRMHDMIQRALAARLAEPGKMHARLLDAWADPDHLPHEYAWRWFGWHCVRAGQRDRLLTLLRDFEWLRSKLEATGIAALVGEFDNVVDDPSARLLQDALRRSAHTLAWDPSQLAAQLLARIPEREQALRKGILERAVDVRKPWLRPLTASLALERSIRWLRPPYAESLSCITFSMNGSWAAYVSHRADPKGGVVFVWNLEKWRPQGLRFDTPPRCSPFALALSDDARWCLYSDSIGGVFRLDALGSPMWDGHEHDDLTIANPLAISADGSRALSACSRGRLIAWDLAGGSHKVIWDTRGNRVMALSLDASGDSAVAAREDGSVYSLEQGLSSARLLFRVHGHPVALARPGPASPIAVATKEGGIEVRSVSQPLTPVCSFSSQEEPTAIALSFDQQYLAIGTSEGTVEVWSIARQARSAIYRRAHTHPVSRIVFSRDSERLVSADLLHIKEWAVEWAETDPSDGTESRASGQVKVTADGRHAVAVLENGDLGMWDMGTGALAFTLPRPVGPAFGDRKIGPPKRLVMAASAPRVLSWNQNLLCVWDLESDARAESLPLENINNACFTPDGKAVVFVAGQCVVQWRPEEGSSWIVATYKGDSPGYVAVAPDGRHALTCGGDRAVHEWPLDEPAGTGRADRLRRWDPHARSKPSNIAFIGPECAVVTTGDGDLFLLDTHEPTSGLHALGSHRSNVLSLLMTSDGRIVTSSFDETVAVWDPVKRRNVASHKEHWGTIAQVSASSQRLLLTSSDGVLKITSLDSGALICAFQGDKQIVSCAADAELKCIAALDQAGQMHFFRVEERG
jgi:WD40 repeat protein